MAIVAVLLALAAIRCGGEKAGPVVGRSKPVNVIIFLADDLGWKDVGYHGSEIRTPNIDRMAREGVVLERYYTSPLCTPTRARLMTGKCALRFGLATNVRPDGSLWVPRDTPLLSEVLGAAGYRTALVGKWHLGFREGYRPSERGFEFSYGILGSWIDHFTHERKGELDWHRNGEPVREEGYSADLLAREAVRWIRGATGKPFFLYMPFTVPHAPVQAPDRWLREYAAIEDPVRRAYAGMVSAMDEAIGRVLHALDETGAADNTIVFFAGDNGANEHQGGSNGNLRGAKWTTYEGCLRVPALFWFPGRLAPRTIDAFVSNLDVYPTMLAAARVAVPTQWKGRRFAPDGVNLLPVLEGRAEPPHRVLPYTFVGRKRVWGALYDPPWKLVVHWRKDTGEAPPELYDVVADPGERVDLAAREQRKVEEMFSRFRSWWMDCTGKDFPIAPDVPVADR